MRPGKTRWTQRLDVPAALYLLLLWGDWEAAHAAVDRDDEDGAWVLYDIAERHEAAWRAIVSRAIVEWATVYPGTRPPSWWYWSAPELRRLTGGDYAEINGAHRCHETGIPYISGGWAHVPMVESTPGFLDRLGLWLPGERARVPASAFDPQPFSYRGSLLTAPRGVPGR